MSVEEKYDYIALGMPMPVDIFTTLGDLISKAWPGADLITDPKGAGVPADVIARLGGDWGSPKQQLVRIPTRRKGKRIAKKEVEAIAEENARAVDQDDTRLNFHGFEATDTGVSIGMSGAEALQHELGAIGLALLDATDGAINYVEWTIIDKESGRRAVLCVARSEAQTAHALRTKAEKKIERALEWIDARESAGLDEHGALVEEMRAILG